MGSSSSLQRSRDRPPPSQSSPNRNAQSARVQIPRAGSNAAGPGASLQQPHYLMFSGPPAPYRFNNGGAHIFYVDSQRQASPPPAVQESTKVKNHANLLKHTLALVPSGDLNKYCISFHCDTAVHTIVQIYYGATEKPDPDTPDSCGAMFVEEGKHYHHTLPIADIPAETDYCYTSQPTHALDVKQNADMLTYSPDRPHVYPVVIVLSYQMPLAEASTEGETPPVSKMQSQYTYAEVCRSPDEETYKLRCIRQRLQLEDGSLFELEDIYGVVEEHQPSSSPGTGAVVGAAVTAADALSVDGDECVICLANERDTTVMPCRHMCLCGECAEVLRRQTNKCPICRTVIECLMTLKKD
eukprot:GGOE01024610.1.p1 GENE.GGOE01024610.1~~GGOE01024610.1.p1  ORF type:complete len:355 (+),score=82.90 GGOE01024610.1:66-1130(+)